MRDHLLGYPPALLALDPEPRVSRETPPRAAYTKDHFECFTYAAIGLDGMAHYITEADCKQIKFNGAADRKVRLEADPPCEADLLRPAAPPSAPKFKVGEEAAFYAWLEQACPSGDCTDVHEQWLRSEARAEWVELAQDEAPAQPAGVWVNGE